MKGCLLLRIGVAVIAGLGCAVAVGQYADYTGPNRLRGAVRHSVISGGAATGATLLPYTLPAGTYTNSAAYPLSLALVVGGKCFDATVAVDNAVVARLNNDCEFGSQSASVLVPPGSTVTWNYGEARATALASGATWDQTGIRFVASLARVEVSRVLVRKCIFAGEMDNVTYSENRTYNFGPNETVFVSLVEPAKIYGCDDVGTPGS